MGDGRWEMETGSPRHSSFRPSCVSAVPHSREAKRGQSLTLPPHRTVPLFAFLRSGRPADRQSGRPAVDTTGASGVSSAVSTLVVIPARYASTRLPGKPLHLLNGKPMVQWVWEAAARVEGVEVLVATEDARIVDAVKKFGGRAVLTSPDCASGTDRVAEAAANTSAEFIINLQGDEPTFTPESVAIVAQALRRGEGMATLDVALDAALAPDPNIVKVVKDARGYALYFSRSPLPYPRNPFTGYRKHLGIYGYRRDVLHRFVGLPQTELEKAESLEQLRALENGILIYVAESPSDSVSVDTAADALQAEALLQRAGPGR